MTQPSNPISRSFLGPVGTRGLIRQCTAHSYQCELLGQASHGALHDGSALECADQRCRKESGHGSFRFPDWVVICWNLTFELHDGGFGVIDYLTCQRCEGKRIAGERSFRARALRAGAARRVTGDTKEMT
jgi:hypothetical protein